MAAEQEAPPAYFAGTSAEFQAIADVLLQTRDGAQLPAHSHLLASTSPVLCNMVTVAASQGQAGDKTVLYLDDFTEQEAVNILKARTCPRAIKVASKTGCWHIYSCLLFGSCIA